MWLVFDVRVVYDIYQLEFTGNFLTAKVTGVGMKVLGLIIMRVSDTEDCRAIEPRYGIWEVPQKLKNYIAMHP